jgi:hypothetical protein
MPTGLKTVALTPDGSGVTITTAKGTFALTQSDIPANVLNKTPAVVETWVNTWLATNLPDFGCVVHVFSLVPLSYTVYTGPLPAPANWWTRGF